MVGEMLVSWKQRHGAGNTLDNPHPLYIVIPWGIAIVALGGGYLYLRLKKDRTTIYGDSKAELTQAKATKAIANGTDGATKTKKGKNAPEKKIELTETAKAGGSKGKKNKKD